MKDVSQITVLVEDNGLFLPLAERLARDCKRVLYHTPWEKGLSTINDAILGDGLENVERVDDIWKVKNEVDLFCFPDVQKSGIQLELESQGYAVWGSRNADRLELDREYFLDVLKETGLDVPKYEVVVGITALRESLKDREDCYIKISKYRGTCETRHWRSWDVDENWLDYLALKLGGIREYIRFIICDAIPTELEIGGDTISVDGQWPDLMIHGIEIKDCAYFGSVTNRSKMPDCIQDVLEAFSPILKEYRARTGWSMEVRKTEDAAYFIDATARFGLPSTGSQCELWDNISEMIWLGAHGEIVQPIPNGLYSAELAVMCKAEDRLWPAVEIPDELKQWLKLADSCEVDGKRVWPREGHDEEHVGWLVAIGDTADEALENIKEYVGLLPDGLKTDVAPLAEALAEIHEEEKQGIEFSDKSIPAPETVLEHS